MDLSRDHDDKTMPGAENGTTPETETNPVAENETTPATEEEITPVVENESTPEADKETMSVTRTITAVAETTTPVVETTTPGAETTTPFVRSLGAWAKPLTFVPPATPPTPGTPSDFDPRYLEQLLDSFWPTLNDGLGQSQKKKQQLVGNQANREFPRMPVPKIPVPELKEDGTLRFPWAARMDPASRNLYRAAKPTFRLDGTPQVTIPSQVLRMGPENKDEYIIGQFHRCSLPPGGLIHGVLNRLWGRYCRIGCRKLSESSYMFHVPHEATHQWVIQRGVWHVDDCLLFVSPWKPSSSFKVPEISTIPVWVNLKNVPDCCYSRLGLSHVASGLGEPMQTHKARLDPTCMGEAKLLVEVELDKPFPKEIALDDKQGNIYLVQVEYTWIPSVCERCGHLGHKEKRCLLPRDAPKIIKTSTESENMSVETPVVEMDMIPNQTTYALQEGNSTEVNDNEDSCKRTKTPTLEGKSPCQATKCIETKELSTPKNSSYSKEEDPTHQKHHDLGTSSYHSVAYVATPTSTKALTLIAPPLVGTSSTPTTNIIMESSPSINTVFGSSHSEDRRLVVNPLDIMSTISPFTPLAEKSMEQHDEIVGVSEFDSFTLTRGGRQVRPTQKIQDMEWTIARGRGKRGRGRGSQHRF